MAQPIAAALTVEIVIDHRQVQQHEARQRAKIDHPREIVDALGSLTDRENAEGSALGGLRDLKAALMSVLLTGEVRVKPDEEAA